MILFYNKLNDILLNQLSNYNLINSINLFNKEQRQEIIIGIEKNIDISMYYNPKLNYKQMEQIRLGLEKNINVSSYNKETFNWLQMNEIRLGIEQGLDVSDYLNPELTWIEMNKIREQKEYFKKKRNNRIQIS